MSNSGSNAAQLETCSPDFWDALAPHHALLEENFLDVRSARLLTNSLQAPVLVVGAGQGLIMAELQKQGFRCDGIDSSPEMIRYASLRRGITLIHADARALPFAPGTYNTIIYATGVVDFIADEQSIRTILNEGRRIVTDSGRMFTAFYRMSEAQERFVVQVGLLSNHCVQHRQSLELYRLKPPEIVAWVANRAGVSRLRAVATLVGLSIRCGLRQLRMTMRVQRIFRDRRTAEAVLRAAPEEQPYRNEAEIRKLFQRLAIPIKSLQRSPSCFIVEL